MRSPSIRMPTFVCACCDRPSTSRAALITTCCGVGVGVGACATRAHKTARVNGATESPKGKRDGRSYSRPVWPTTGMFPRGERLAVRVEEANLAEVQIPNPRLDLRAIAHHDP